MTPPLTDSSGNELTPNANGVERWTNLIGDFIGRVGLPVLIVLVLMVLLVGTWVGYFSSPMVTSAAFDQHRLEAATIHASIVLNNNEQTKVLKEMKEALKGLICSQQPTDKGKVACFDDLNRMK